MDQRQLEEFGEFLERNSIAIALWIVVGAVGVSLGALLLTGCAQVTVIAGESNAIEKESGVILVNPKQGLPSNDDAKK